MPLTKRIRLWTLLLLLAACQPQSASRVTLMVDGQPRAVASGDLVPAHLLAGAGIAFSPTDRVLADGVSVPLDQALSQQAQIVLQLRRAVNVTLIAPNGQITVSTAAFTVGEALQEAGVNLFVSDRVEPDAATPLADGMTVTITPGREVNVQAAGQTVRVRSSAMRVGEVLAEAGIPLMGLDTAHPSENEPLPADGQIRIVRVTESLASVYKVIPYATELIVTAELQPPAQDVLDAGEVGISVSRTRVRYEDGAEIARVVENESVIRLPRTRVARSSFWAAKEMYATSYSPCNSGVDACLYGTSLGIPVAHGVVGMIREWYLALKGAQVYIPGYGYAIVADVGGGFPDGRAWIDLGYSDSDYVGWSSWVTVYFIPPAPPEVPWFLK
ncbi:MAG: DUF348 domain-containing protein [Chloroflexi bacterium]|nr:DUF348 domain-containing protein [Chloroflexota bacterium]